MDPVTVGALLLAIVSGAAGQAGERLWSGVAALVRRPFAHRGSAAGTAELEALEQEPHNQERALLLAEALMARAGADASFRHELETWWEQARDLATGTGNVTNTISGGTQHGPVLMGRDFAGLTFGALPPSETRPSN